MKELTDAETAVSAYMRFREEVQAAGLRMDPTNIVQLLIADRLNVIGRELAELNDTLSCVYERLVELRQK